MGRRSAIDPTLRREIVRRFHAGETLVALAASYGITRHAVQYYAGSRKAHNSFQRSTATTTGIAVASEAVRLKDRTEREAENARQDTLKAAHDRAVHAALASAKPTGERCKTKACPYPALLADLCRHCYQDRHSDRSYVGSQSQSAISQAYI